MQTPGRMVKLYVDSQAKAVSANDPTPLQPASSETEHAKQLMDLAKMRKQVCALNSAPRLS